MKYCLTHYVSDHVLLSPNVLTAIDWPTLVHVSTQQNEPDLEATENAGVIADSQSANVFRCNASLLHNTATG